MTRPHLPCPDHVAPHEWKKAVDYTAALIAKQSAKLAWWVDADQLALDGWIALWRATETWEPARGVLLSTYAGKRVWGHLLQVIRNQAPCGIAMYRRCLRDGRPVPSPMSLDTPLGDEEVTVADVLADERPGPEALLCEREEQERVEEALLTRLDPTEQEIFGLNTSTAMTHEQIGAQLGMSTSQVRRRLQGVRRELARYVAEMAR